MACSLMMCLQANGIECNEDEVNKVMGARPRKGASWENALAAAQHYGMRATLTTPATVKQLKAWTDAKVPVMIAWNPECRDWSHASVVYHVAEGPIEVLDETQTLVGSGPGLYVFIADPNIPHPDKTTRVMHEDEFYGKWYEKWPDYLVRRPACAIAREITSGGRQVMASANRSTPEGPLGPYRMAASRVADRWMHYSTAELSYLAAQSPNQVGSSAMLERQGLTPVDYMFGEALSHRRPVVMQGEELQDRRGDLWFFVGVDEDGQAILAKDERDLKRKMQELMQERLHHVVGRSTKRRRKKRKPQSGKDKLRVPTEAPKRRNLVMQQHIEQGSGGAGSHHNRLRDVARGRSRKVKHKEDLRRQQHAAERIADRYMSTRQAGKGNGKLDRRLKSQINKALIRGGLDGNGRFRKPEQAYSKALDILRTFDIEQDEVVSSHLFNARPGGSVRVDLAFTNHDDLFSPVSITNSLLYLQFTELREGVFEAVAYLS